MEKYKTLADAKKDGWQLIPCAFPTRYNYYRKGGEQRREDELIATDEEEYKKGFQKGYAIGASPSASDNHHPDYIRGYNVGYQQACDEADEAFQSQYSYEREN